MCICSFLVWKNACLNYREFDLEGDLVGVPHTWYLSAQPFITLIKLVWRQYDIVAMNEWRKKWVGLQRTWVSKRTVSLRNLGIIPLAAIIHCSDSISMQLYTEGKALSSITDNSNVALKYDALWEFGQWDAERYRDVGLL